MKLTKIAVVLVVSLLAFSLAACSAPKDSEATSTSGNTDIATLLATQPKNAEEAAELHQKLMQKENEILSNNSKLWEKVFLAANKDMPMIEDGKNYGDFLLDTIEGAKDQFSAEELKMLKTGAQQVKEIEDKLAALEKDFPGCGSSPSSGESVDASSAGMPNSAGAATSEGKFPSFQGKDLDGNEVASDKVFSGSKVTVVNFWFTTCKPCVGELGDLEALNKELASKGGQVVGVNSFTLDGDATAISEAKDILAKKGVTYKNVWFASSSEAGKFTSELFSYPTTYVVDKNGNIVEEWISTGEAHLIEGILTAGETYTLREISAPNGWTISEYVTFTVNIDGSLTHVEMYDKPTSVSLRKVDTDGNDIKGAVMQLLDKDGNVIEEWTTDGNAHILTAQLIAGETYTLHEKSAPAGYELAKDQTFTVPDDGEITVTMTDEKAPTTPPVATPTTPTSTATPKTTSTPKTGDATPVMAIGTGLLASFLIMLLTRRKKRRNRKAA